MQKLGCDKYGHRWGKIKQEAIFDQKSLQNMQN